MNGRLIGLFWYLQASSCVRESYIMEKYKVDDISAEISKVTYVGVVLYKRKEMVREKLKVFPPSSKT